MYKDKSEDDENADKSENTEESKHCTQTTDKRRDKANTDDITSYRISILKINL